MNQKIYHVEGKLPKIIFLEDTREQQHLNGTEIISTWLHIEVSLAWLNLALEYKSKVGCKNSCRVIEKPILDLGQTVCTKGVDSSYVSSMGSVSFSRIRPSTRITIVIVKWYAVMILR